MSRIGIVTFHRAVNYGAVLQAYALQRTVRACGADCDIIDFRSRFVERIYKPFYIKKGTLRYRAKNAVIALLHWRHRIRKAKAFERFVTGFLGLSPAVHGTEELQALRYDACITGSDQVFNPYIAGGDAWVYYLDFVPPDVIRFSYAASFGTKALPEKFQERAKAELDKFACVSVRESSGIDIVEDLSGTEARVDLDPTLLLEPEVWSGLEVQPAGFEKPYILVYNMLPTELLYETAERLRREKQTEVVFVNNKSQGLKSRHPHFRYVDTVSPLEFLWLFDHAEYVLSSSFHGNVFAILFHKPFAAILPKHEPRNERSIALLEQVHLQDRLFTGEFDPDKALAEPDWPEVDRMLAGRRERSLAYLRGIVSAADSRHANG